MACGEWSTSTDVHERKIVIVDDTSSGFASSGLLRLCSQQDWQMVKVERVRMLDEEDINLGVISCSSGTPQPSRITFMYSYW